MIQILLDPPQVVWHYSFLSGGSIAFANVEKDLVVQSRFHKTITQLTRCYVEWGKRFYKNRRFSGFSDFNGTLVRFSIKIDDFGFDVQKISLSGIVVVS